jgi:hypothetical protein
MGVCNGWHCGAQLHLDDVGAISTPDSPVGSLSSRGLIMDATRVHSWMTSLRPQGQHTPFPMRKDALTVNVQFPALDTEYSKTPVRRMDRVKFASPMHSSSKLACWPVLRIIGQHL